GPQGQDETRGTQACEEGSEEEGCGAKARGSEARDGGSAARRRCSASAGLRAAAPGSPGPAPGSARSAAAPRAGSDAVERVLADSTSGAGSASGADAARRT